LIIVSQYHNDDDNDVDDDDDNDDDVDSDSDYDGDDDGSDVWLYVYACLYMQEIGDPDRMFFYTRRSAQKSKYEVLS